ncbi:hypothetical protein GCM10023224_19900 [Streptomonospora halophila]|uniref:Uncharacterized protein n=1 Tax=Streptomonospora halophila TaxID=427369 RepID=A0ABP9GDH0_9ACTN
MNGAISGIAPGAAGFVRMMVYGVLASGRVGVEGAGTNLAGIRNFRFRARVIS